jgi:hypothetical protein
VISGTNATSDVVVCPEIGKGKVFMSFDARPNPAVRLSSTLLVAASVAIPVILAARLVLNFRHEYFLTHVEGAWLTCAYDFVHGVFYRPLFSGLGYGGTRYFPLYFVLTGLFSRLFGSLAASGLFLSAASVVVLCGAVFAFLRRSGASLLLSVAGVTSLLAVATTQQALLTAKGDSLAAVLNFCGLALCLNSKVGRTSLYAAALLFTLAFATKLTTVFGVAAVVLGWTFARRYKDALQLALASGFGYILVLAVMYFGSSGRVFSIFRACAGGGGSVFYTLQAPIHLLSKALEVDPVFLFFLLICTAFSLVSAGKAYNGQANVLRIYLVLVLLVTTVIFGSPGIGINHFLDLQVAVVLTVVLSIVRVPEFGEIGPALLALSLLVALVPTAQDLHGDLHRRSISTDAVEVVARIPADARPILAENPVVLLKSGKTPYLLDPFMFRILAAKQPSLAKDFWEKMNQRGFSAIVLQYDPGNAEGKVWYTETHFGGEFLRDLEANYSPSYTVGQMHVYTPK